MRPVRPPPRQALFSHSKQRLVFLFFLWYTYHKMTEPQGSQAARLRQRKFELLHRFPLPPDLLPGSLSFSHLRCGKPTCHCAKAKDPGHEVWSLTFMVAGHKHVQHVPKPWVEQVRKRVEAGRAFQDAVREVLAANAQLLVLARRQQKSPKKRRS